MPGWIVDVLIFALVLLLTYALSSEGLWGAALMFFNVLFAGIITFNFYEPLAGLVDKAGINWGFTDALCMMAVFCVAVLLLRLTTETVAPAMVRFPTPIYHIGRLAFAFATSVVLMGILLLGFHVAPVHKKIFGAIDYKTQPPFGMGFDHGWLAFFQYTTGQVFVTHTDRRDPFIEYGDANVFDPKGEWLLIHQEARPYGDDKILGDEAGAGGAAGGAEGGGAPAAGGMAPSGPAAPGAMPGAMPSGSSPSGPGAMPGAMPPGGSPPTGAPPR